MLKTIPLIIISCYFIKTANSQITKGTWMLSGTISFSSTNYNSDAGSKSNYINLQVYPHVGYFFADKFAAGLNAGINRYGTKAISTNVYDSYTDFNTGPFVRYYLLAVDNQINIVTEGSYMYGFFGGGQSQRSTSKNTYAFNAGPVIYFNETAGLEFLVGYSSYKYVGFSGRDNTIQLGLGLQVNLRKDK